MSQFDFGNLESPLTGEDFINDKLEPWRDALHTLHAGSTRPSYVQAGMLWLDNSTTPWVLKLFQGSQDIVIGQLDISGLKFGLSGATIENTPIGQTTPAALTATTIRYTQDIDFSSDRRLKKNIKPLRGMLDMLMKLAPVSYRRKSLSSRTHFGFIAQQVKGVAPSMVGRDDNGHLTLHGMDLVAVLTGAVQELTKRVEKLEKRKGKAR